MKNLLLSTAMLAATTLGASAQDMFRGEPAPDEIRASDLMGMRVYASADATDATEIEGVQDNWDDIGEINDIVLGRDGSVQAVLVDVGGFLGIGERTVAVSMASLQMVSDSATPDDVNDYFLVVNADQAAIESAPEYMAPGAMEGEDAAAMGSEQATDVAAASDAAAAAGTEPTDEVMAEPAADGATAADDTTEPGVEMDASETAENAVEETGEEVADGAAEVTDEVADAGEEVAEEAGQVGMTDTQEDAAEAADTQADATEEATEEQAQATGEAADEQADTAEAMAEGNTEAADGTMTEGEMEATDTADAAAGDAAMTEETATTDTAAATDTTMATDDAAAADATMAEGDAAARTPYSREGYAPLGADMMTADALEGAAVYDVNDERVGEVGEILIDDAGAISNLVIDVGGFLGLGQYPVALPLDSVDILKQDGGDDLRIYVSQTEDQLKSMERYEAQ